MVGVKCEGGVYVNDTLLVPASRLPVNPVEQASGANPNSDSEGSDTEFDRTPSSDSWHAFHNYLGISYITPALMTNL
jgi:hypothetical protein